MSFQWPQSSPTITSASSVEHGGCRLEHYEWIWCSQWWWDRSDLHAGSAVQETIFGFVCQDFLHSIFGIPHHSYHIKHQTSTPACISEIVHHPHPVSHLIPSYWLPLDSFLAPSVCQIIGTKDVLQFNSFLFILTLHYPGFELLLDIQGGGSLRPPPLESVRMKLQRRVRGQIMGSWVCPVHLDYFQMADMCISRVFTWF